MRLLLDEIYADRLASALRAAGIEANTVRELELTGAGDDRVFATAATAEYVLLTENVGDFTRLAAEHTIKGSHHSGFLIALSSRFSRRPAGIASLVEAVRAVADEALEDRVVYLKRPTIP